MKKLICMLLAVVMVFAMAACSNENKEAYEAAVAAYNAGNYEEAANMLIALGDYKDAAQMLSSIKAEKAGVTTTVTTADGEFTTTTEYVFKDGNLVKENITYADGTVTKSYYKYNDAGLCTSETHNTTSGGKIVINHFYEDGIKTRTIRTNADKSKDTYEYVCDENGNILSHTQTLSNGTTQESTYTYNEAGQLSVLSAENLNVSYEYNAFGDVVKESVASNGEVTRATTYAYVYTFIVG